MKYRLLVILIPLMQMGFAQTNLVPNPSFEIITNCPNSLGQLNLASSWFSANQGSPDLYNICGGSNYVTVPCNFTGCSLPHSGSGYCGILLTDNTDGDREYISAKLISPMEANKVYCIEFYTSLGDSCNFASNNMGVSFTPDSLFESNYNLISSNSTMLYFELIIDDTAWLKMSFSYIASGGETYIVIGNFKNNSNTITKVLSEPYTEKAYYYIDDVSVTECNIPDIEAITKPNVFTPNGDGYNDTFVIQSLPLNSKLTIYNRWGNEVYFSNNYQNNWDGAGLADGVYFYVLTLPSGNSTKGTITILRNN